MKDMKKKGENCKEQRKWKSKEMKNGGKPQTCLLGAPSVNCWAIMAHFLKTPPCKGSGCMAASQQC
jgi:hypothetical protein